MPEIAVIGGSEFVLGFQLAGIKKVCEEETPEKKMLELMKDDGVGIIITDEKTMGRLSEYTREAVEISVKPVTVVVSDEGSSQEGLRKMIKKSIGIDLWK